MINGKTNKIIYKNTSRGFTRTYMRTSKRHFNFVFSFVKSLFTIPKSNRAYIGGFTLAETLVAMMIFTTIVTFGISALVNMSRDYRITGEMRQSLDTLNFVMEDISRNIRLGTTFACVTGGTAPDLIHGATFTPADCTASLGFQGSVGLTFQAFDSESSNGHQIIYLIDPNGISSGKGILYKASFTGNDPISVNPPAVPFFAMTPSTVYIDGAKSGFSIYNNAGPNSVPAVSFRLVGTVQYQNTSVPFDLQTTITPRNRQ